MAIVAAAAAVGIGWLSASLPPDGFFSGDSGLKLIAAWQAIEHPTRPFEIDLPSIKGRPVAYVDPMVAAHDDHGHVLQSPVFPVISAPLLAALGLRGAYVLPAVAFVVLLPLLELIRRRAVPETSFPLLAWIAVAANPLLFYSLEFWEHSPAAALLAASTAAAVLGWGVPGRLWIAAASGLLAGVSVLLRPEAIWYVAALGFVSGRRQWLAFGSGVAALLVPFAAANLAHSGSVLGPHAAASLAPLPDDFFAARGQRLASWLWPHSAVAAIALSLVAGAWVTRVFNLELGTRQLVGLCGVAAVSVLASQKLLPRESLWQAFPLSLLALVPVSAAPNSYARRLYIVSGIAALGVVLTATHDGGAQWGPRFLLVAVPPLIVLSARGATDAVRPGRGRRARVALVALALIAGLATSRAAYRELRGAKRDYARLVSAAAALTSPGGVVLTNVWWFDQIAAPLHRSRIVLYAPDGAAAAEALADLSKSGIRDVSLVWTSEEDGQPLTAAVDGSCFRILTVRDIPLRQLRVASAQCQAE